MIDKTHFIFQYAWVKAKTLCQSQFFNEPQRRREASALGGFPDLFAQRLPLGEATGATQREEKNA